MAHSKDRAVKTECHKTEPTGPRQDLYNREQILHDYKTNDKNLTENHAFGMMASENNGQT